jgi:hypothetical protein
MPEHVFQKKDYNQIIIPRNNHPTTILAQPARDHLGTHMKFTQKPNETPRNNNNPTQRRSPRRHLREEKTQQIAAATFLDNRNWVFTRTTSTSTPLRGITKKASRQVSSPNR